MPKYLITANYIGEGIKGLLKEGGSSRRAAIEKVAKSAGGTVESIYYAFGETDVFVIADMPDNASMAGLSLVVNASGAVTAKTVVLMTPEEMDEAAKKTVEYRPPGQ
jgi:uncharacterized protein with GYD domain